MKALRVFALTPASGSTGFGGGVGVGETVGVGVGLGSLGSGAVDGVLALVDGGRDGRSAAATGEFLAQPATRIIAASTATPRSDVDAERPPSDRPISTSRDDFDRAYPVMINEA
ncbi:MAG TPA: hypothetical protein VGK17_03575 [Propionicimonas sp.]